MKSLTNRLALIFSLVIFSALSACGGGGGGDGGGGAAPAPIIGVIALPKTGQTTCSDASGVAIGCAGTGQDGELQTGVTAPSPRFVVNDCGTPPDADDVVTDNLTGLMWTKNANLLAGNMGATDNGARTWQQALDFANNLNLCGFTDWRLANHKELRSLVNYNEANNAIALNALGFSSVQADFYWSSSSFASGSVAQSVDMNVGVVSLDLKANSHSVWPVRAGQ